uniref:VQ domain-containing protein n=1 Tax=Cajanus cajan TaxID=3821 RepID=A0A151SE53_CAJCA|nr:hypothetical protein KK1_024934 [Cajanus cajan]KYP53115.1 hypothetical protein KK1_024937 [Cajanus cajan]
MEAYSSSNPSYLTQQREESKHVYPLQSHNSVRKSAAKSWNKKAPVAPMAPTPVKVYKVDAINFRDLVQQLTGAPEHKPQLRQQLLQINITDVPNSLPNQNQASGDTQYTEWYHNFQFGTSSHF